MIRKETPPEKIILVCRHEGREVGRVPATARNAQEYIRTLTSHYESLQIEEEERELEASLDRMLGLNRY